MNNCKMEELRLLVQNNRLDIVGITESWLHEGIGEAEIGIPGFTVFRRDRVIGMGGRQRGGGVLLYVNNRVAAVNVSDQVRGLNESVWVSIRGRKNKEVIVGVCYCSPSASKEEEDNLMENIKFFSKKQATVIMGDFNHADINWDSLQATSQRGKNFMDTTTDLFLTQHVQGYTRGNSILDLVFSTEKELVEELAIGNPISTSDHCAIEWVIKCDTVSAVSNIVQYNYHKGNYEKLILELGSIDWGKEFYAKGVEEMWISFLKIVSAGRDRNIPKRGKGEKGIKQIWMKAKIIKLIKKRNKLWKNFRKAPSFEREVRYKNLRNCITLEIRRAKEAQERKIADGIRVDPKSFYAYIRSNSQSRVRVGPLNGAHGDIVSDDLEMARILNGYFSSTFTTEDVSRLPKPSLKVLKGRNLELKDASITEDKIRRTLDSLQENKAAGVDGLNSTFLKHGVDGIVKPLVKIFQESLSTGKVPEDWRLANVSALYKKGSKKDPGNYRPVSLTSQICKIFERVLKDEITNYLESNNLLWNSQHGFRKNKSCLTNLLEFMQMVSDGLDEGEPMDVLYLDFSKAFDKVPHRRLLLKLEAMGIGGKVLRWIEAWLHGRKQRVVLNGKCSEWAEVRSGVPQGSVLGPILFIIYINDIDEGIVNKISKFADDTKLLGRVGSLDRIEEMRDDINRLMEWSSDWQMTFNLEKCNVMHLGNKNPEVVYEMNGKALGVVSEEKDLGVIISKDLKVSKQCGVAAKKGFQILGLISRSFVCREQSFLVPLYKSLVRPHLDYSMQAWRPHLQKDIAVLERVQRRATRMIRECKGLDYESRLKKVGLTSLEIRRVRGDMIEVFKILKGLENLDESIFFQRCNYEDVNIDNRKTRGNVFKLYKKRVRLDVARFGFGNRIVRDWNKLPNKVVMSSNVNTFKGNLDKYLRQTRGLI